MLGGTKNPIDTYGPVLEQLTFSGVFFVGDSSWPLVDSSWPLVVCFWLFLGILFGWEVFGGRFCRFERWGKNTPEILTWIPKVAIV